MFGGTTGSASDQQSTNDRKVAGSRPTKVMCIIVLTGNRRGELSTVAGRHSFFRAVGLIDQHGLTSAPTQYSIGYTADSFNRSNDPTNSVKALKEGG